jgi:hypothetical protein
MAKVAFLAGFAAGYLLGARAGRERYEQIAGASKALLRNEKVQQARSAAGARGGELLSTAGHKVGQQLNDKVGTRLPGWAPGRRAGAGTEAWSGAADDSHAVDLSQAGGLGQTSDLSHNGRSS